MKEIINKAFEEICLEESRLNREIHTLNRKYGQEGCRTPKEIKPTEDNLEYYCKLSELYSKYKMFNAARRALQVLNEI